ncbi:MAG: hypothetical protein C0492_07565 [Verminephrobacter sp.]|nr:hypothetical protein [Verminephrobacter sp.]
MNFVIASIYLVKHFPFSAPDTMSSIKRSRMWMVLKISRSHRLRDHCDKSKIMEGGKKYSIQRFSAVNLTEGFLRVVLVA